MSHHVCAPLQHLRRLGFPVRSATRPQTLSDQPTALPSQAYPSTAFPSTHQHSNFWFEFAFIILWD
eukprot:m.148522 g.148522  ORF g.148522 m.148522 type:complete len:66 (+) comp14186_c0_seq1:827-1024(+)